MLLISWLTLVLGGLCIPPLVSPSIIVELFVIPNATQHADCQSDPCGISKMFDVLAGQLAFSSPETSIRVFFESGTYVLDTDPTIPDFVFLAGCSFHQLLFDVVRPDATVTLQGNSSSLVNSILHSSTSLTSSSRALFHLHPSASGFVEVRRIRFVTLSIFRLGTAASCNLENFDIEMEEVSVVLLRGVSSLFTNLQMNVNSGDDDEANMCVIRSASFTAVDFRLFSQESSWWISSGRDDFDFLPSSSGLWFPAARRTITLVDVVILAQHQHQLQENGVVVAGEPTNPHDEVLGSLVTFFGQSAAAVALDSYSLVAPPAVIGLENVTIRFSPTFGSLDSVLSIWLSGGVEEIRLETVSVQFLTESVEHVDEIEPYDGTVSKSVITVSESAPKHESRLRTLSFSDVLVDSFPVAQFAVSATLESASSPSSSSIPKSVSFVGCRISDVSDGTALLVSGFENVTISESSFFGTGQPSDDVVSKTTDQDRARVVEKAGSSSVDVVAADGFVQIVMPMSSTSSSSLVVSRSLFGSTGSFHFPRRSLVVLLRDDEIQRHEGYSQMIRLENVSFVEMIGRAVSIEREEDGFGKSSGPVGDVVIKGCTFRDLRGGALMMQNGKSLAIRGSSFADAEATTAVVIDGVGSVVVDETKFTNCEIAVLATLTLPNSELRIESSNFTSSMQTGVVVLFEGTSSSSGYLSRQSFNVVGSFFQLNGDAESATGGAIHVIAGGKGGDFDVTISSCTFEENSASIGGAVAVSVPEGDSFLSLSFNNTSGHRNRAHSGPGGFCSVECLTGECRLAVRGGEMNGNTALNGSAGIHAEGKISLFEVSQATFSSNLVSRLSLGSAIHFQTDVNCSVTFVGCAFLSNGPFKGKSSQVYLDSADFMAIWISDCVVANSPGLGMTLISRGGFLAASFVSVTFDSNVEGALVLEEAPSDDSFITDGEESRLMIAIPIILRDVSVRKSTLGVSVALHGAHDLILSHCVFDNVYSQALSLDGSSSLSLLRIENSTTMHLDGGAVCFVVSQGVVRSTHIVDSSFRECSVFLEDGDIAIETSQFLKGHHLTANGADVHLSISSSVFQDGSGLSLLQFAFFEGTKLNITSNSKADGGGLFVRFNGGDGESFRLMDSLVRGNHASNRGGGMMFCGITDPSVFIQLGVSVSVVQNRASFGGGIFYNLTSYDTLTFVLSTVELNSATKQAGGVYIDTLEKNFDVVSRLAPKTAVRDNFAPSGKDFMLPPSVLDVPGSVQCNDVAASRSYHCRVADIAMHDLHNEHALISRNPDGFSVRLSSSNTHFSSFDLPPLEWGYHGWEAEFAVKRREEFEVLIPVNFSLVVRDEVQDTSSSRLIIVRTPRRPTNYVVAIIVVSVILCLVIVGVGVFVALFVMLCRWNIGRRSKTAGLFSRNAAISHDEDENKPLLSLDDLPISFRDGKKKKKKADYDDTSTSSSSSGELRFSSEEMDEYG